MSMPSDPGVYEGRLADGRTAASLHVNVRLTADGLHILPAGERGAPLAWPYASLRSSVPLRADATDILLSLEPAGTQTLFVADRAFSRSLRARAGHLSAARQRLKWARPGAAFAAVVAVLVGTGWYLDVRPSQTVARMLPQDIREAMGRNVVASMQGGMRRCETPAGRAALDRLTGRLAAASSDEAMSVRVVLIDWTLPNAFAAPGGQLVLTRGLVEMAGSADEVAGVLAHEMGHALELHPESGLIRSVGLSIAGDLIFAGAGTGANLGIALLDLRYSRNDEREADAHALRILKNAGISPRGFGDFFERLENLFGAPGRKEKDGEARKGSGGFATRLETILSTHPLTRERIDLVRSQPAYEATPALSDSEWQALRNMCAASVFPDPRRPSYGPGGDGRGNYDGRRAPDYRPRGPGPPGGGTSQEPERPRGGTNL